jgi:hypothetical protein
MHTLRLLRCSEENEQFALGITKFGKHPKKCEKLQRKGERERRGGS